MSRGKQALLTVVTVLAAIAIVAGPVTARTDTGPVAGTDELAPEAVTNLDAVPVATGIELSWDLSVSDFVRQSPVGTDFTSGGTFVNVNDVATYDVYKSEAGGPYELIGFVLAGEMAYVDETVVSGSSFTYMVKAADAAGNVAEVQPETLPINLGEPPTMVVSVQTGDEIDFGDVAVGAVGEFEITIENAASVTGADLTATIAVAGDGFSASTSRISIVQGDAGQSASVFFTPVDVGNINASYAGTLTIRSNDPNNRQIIVDLSALITTGVDVPDIRVAPASIAFSQRKLNSTGNNTLILNNVGGLTLTGSIAVTSEAVGSSPAFTISGSKTINQPPDTPREIIVSFTPTVVGQVTGAITFTTNDPDEPTVIVPLRGIGVTEIKSPGKVVTRVIKARVTFNTVIDLEDNVVVEDFIANFKAALAKTLGISPSRIKNIVLREGSVIVDFDIAKTSDPDAGEPTAEAAVANLTVILSDPAAEPNDITAIAPVDEVVDTSEDVELVPEDTDGNAILGWFTRGGTRVGVDDFFLFAEFFGLNDTEIDFDATFDIEPSDAPNGKIDLDDFFLFAEDFGKTVVNAAEIQDALN